MSDENKYSISDVIDFASQQKPVDVKAAFDELMLAKIHSAIEDKKIEVAKQMFGSANVDAELEDIEIEDEVESEEETADETEEEDLDFEISDDELEDLLSDLENNLEDENTDSEETDDGEEA